MCTPQQLQSAQHRSNSAAAQKQERLLTCLRAAGRRRASQRRVVWPDQEQQDKAGTDRAVRCDRGTQTIQFRRTATNFEPDAAQREQYLLDEHANLRERVEACQQNHNITNINKLSTAQPRSKGGCRETAAEIDAATRTFVCGRQALLREREPHEPASRPPTTQ
jgi:hypothetical protein